MSMPATCRSSYRRVAVMKVDLDQLPAGRDEPTMISERARGVIEIVQLWEKLYNGKTERCSFARALREAEELADRLNVFSKTPEEQVQHDIDEMKRGGGWAPPSAPASIERKMN